MKLVRGPEKTVRMTYLHLHNSSVPITVKTIFGSPEPVRLSRVIPLLPRFWSAVEHNKYGGQNLREVHSQKKARNFIRKIS